MKARILALIGALILVVGCVGRPLPKLPTAVPAAVDASDAQVRAASVAGLRILGSIGDVVNDMSRIRASLEADGVGTPEMHRAVSQRLISLSQMGLSAIARLKAGVSTWSEIKALIDPMLAHVNPLIDTIQSASGTVRSRLEAFGLQIYGLVLQLVGVGSGQSVSLSPAIVPAGA